MKDKEKFEGLKQQVLAENRAKYGKELDEKYGAVQMAASEEKVANMSQEQWNAQKAEEWEIASLLKEAMELGDPACVQAQRACDLQQGAKSASKPALRLMQQAQAALFLGANPAVLQRLALHKAGGQGGQLFGGGRADLHALHARGLGALVGPVNERLHGVGSALHQRLDAAIAAVAHPAVQAQALGLLDGGVAVVHALHQAIHTQMAGQSG